MFGSLKKIIVALVLLIAKEGYLQGNEEALSSAPLTYCPDDCGVFFTEVNALYLRAYEGGLFHPCDSTQITDVNEGSLFVSSLKGKGYEPNFKWSCGFRIGAGYGFAANNCDIGAYWTHYHSHTKDTNNKNGRKWKINLDVVDVVYRCDCKMQTCLFLTPFGGLRGASINQKLFTRFIDTVNGIPATSNGHSKEEFLSIGPLFGVEGHWLIGCGFSLYSKISASVLYGTFRIRSNVSNESSTEINNSHLCNRIHACQPAMDVGFGLEWKKCLCSEMMIIVQLGLEEHRYFNLNQFCSYGDLSLDGLSLNISIEY